jgi:hypothetical protein
MLASGLFPVVAFWAYTVLTDKPLRVDIAFPALQLFGMLENYLRELPNLITVRELHHALLLSSTDRRTGPLELQSIYRPSRRVYG